MTAKELDTMVKAMRNKRNTLDMRIDVQATLFYLHKGLSAIGRTELADELARLYTEIDNVDTDELVKLGTFK